MKRMLKTMVMAIFLSIFLVGGIAGSGAAGEYEALKGVNSTKTIFDFRDGNTGTVLIHAQLIHQTYQDQAIRSVSKEPEFVVVFMDMSVVLLSKNRDKYSSEEKKQLEELDKTITAMAEDGIRLEICEFAMNALGVNPESVSPEIIRVGNGWIASLGYQQRGYSVVPAY